MDPSVASGLEADCSIPGSILCAAEAAAWNSHEAMHAHVAMPQGTPSAPPPCSPCALTHPSTYQPGCAHAPLQAALTEAARSGCIHTTRTLLEAGASPCAEALQLACALGHEGIVEMLLDR